MLQLDGAPHKRERKLLMPPFHGERMQAYGTIMRDITDSVMKEWPPGRPFAFHTMMQQITLDVILRAVMGIKEVHRFHQLRSLLTELLGITGNPASLLFSFSGEVRVPWFLKPFAGWMQLDRFEALKRQVDDLLYDEFAKRRVSLSADDQDILSLLLQARDEDGNAMIDVELRDEMMTLLVAGHETSATTLCWLFCHLIEHPEALQRIADELDAVVGEGPVTGDHVKQLVYLDAAIKETLRLTPILPIVARHLNVPMTLGDRTFPADVKICPCIYLSHRRPDVWPEPTRFNPERFLDQRVAPFEWFPFGGGVRRCIGMAFATFEMKIVAAHLIRHWRLRFAPGYRPRVRRRGISLSPSGGMQVIASAIQRAVPLARS